jgi:hypothetical protein
MAEVIQLEIVGIEDFGVGRTCAIQGKGAPGGSVRSGDRAAVSICLGNLSDHFLRGSDETARSLVLCYGEIRGKGRGVCYPFRCARNISERHTRFLNKQAEQSLVVSNAAKVVGMSGENSRHSP